MTKADVVNQLFSLSRTHRFNGEVRSKNWLNSYIKNMFRTGSSNDLFMTIELPDGEWLFVINRYSDGWYYDIPDTREQESFLWDCLAHKKSR